MMILTFRCFAVFLVVLLLASTGEGAKKAKKAKKAKQSKKCEKPSLCLPNPCKNSGECSVEDSGSGFNCTCPSPSGSGFNCTCPSPYIGVICDSVEMDVAVNKAIWTFDSYGEVLGDSGFLAHSFESISFNSSLVVVNNYLAFVATDSCFSIRVNGTFLGGDEMLCKELLYTEIDDFVDKNVGEWKEPGFVVPENHAWWLNPEQAVDCPDLFFPGDVEGSTIIAPADKRLWLGGMHYVVCRVEIEDLYLNLLE